MSLEYAVRIVALEERCRALEERLNAVIERHAAVAATVETSVAALSVADDAKRGPGRPRKAD